MIKPVAFYSEGVRLAGDLYFPDDLEAGERRAGIVLCHGYTGVRTIYLPDNARALAEAGYVVLNFDYKGWGDSDGPRTRLAPYSRVADVQAALTFLAAQPEIDSSRLGLYGTSYGGATVVWVAAVDPRVRCTVAVVGIGNGARWMRSVRRPDEYYDLLERAAADRTRRALAGKSEFVPRGEILLPDRNSAEIGAKARLGNPGAVTEVPLEFVDDTLDFNPNGWSTRSPRGRSCSSPPTATASSRRQKAKPSTPAPASQNKLVTLKAGATTKSTKAKPSARSWMPPPSGTSSTCRREQAKEHLPPLPDLPAAATDVEKRAVAEQRQQAEAEAKRLAKHAWSVQNLPDPGQAALCLSGGGIRSAAFALGILQGLARRDLLRQFHYLSTVSGGGYIGSWFTAWRHRIDSIRC